jgi:hypothetical protein
LAKEAATYVKRFVAQEKTLNFRIGAGDFTNGRALVYAIEGAKALCAGGLGIDRAVKLLEMATDEAREAQKHWKESFGE